MIVCTPASIRVCYRVNSCCHEWWLRGTECRHIDAVVFRFPKPGLLRNCDGRQVAVPCVPVSDSAAGSTELCNCPRHKSRQSAILIGFVRFDADTALALAYVFRCTPRD